MQGKAQRRRSVRSLTLVRTTSFMTWRSSWSCRFLGRAMADRPGTRTRPIAVGSSVAVRLKLKNSVGVRGIHVRQRTLHLGIDYAAGAIGMRKRGQQSRLKEARRRFPRIRRLGAVGGPQVFRAGIVQAIRYGSSALGMGSATPESIRYMAARIPFRVGWRSTSARLAFHGDDPTEQILVPAIKAWADAVWTLRHGHRLEACLRHLGQRNKSPCRDARRKPRPTWRP